MRFLRKIIACNAIWLFVGLSADCTAEGLRAVVPAEPGSDSRLRVVRPIDREISYDATSRDNRLLLTLEPFEWKKVTKRDGRRRWRVNMDASRPIHLYFVYPGHDVGNPPDGAWLNSATRKKWLNTTKIEEDKFLPWHNEYGVGRTWSFYLFNNNDLSARVYLSVDTSGKAIPEEKKYRPFMFIGLILLTGAVTFFMYKLLQWRRKKPLGF